MGLHPQNCHAASALAGKKRVWLAGRPCLQVARRCPRPASHPRSAGSLTAPRQQRPSHHAPHHAARELAGKGRRSLAVRPRLHPLRHCASLPDSPPASCPRPRTGFAPDLHAAGFPATHHQHLQSAPWCPCLPWSPPWQHPRHPFESASDIRVAGSLTAHRQRLQTNRRCPSHCTEPDPNTCSAGLRFALPQRLQPARRCPRHRTPTPPGPCAASPLSGPSASPVPVPSPLQHQQHRRHQ